MQSDGNEDYANVACGFNCSSMDSVADDCRGFGDMVWRKQSKKEAEALKWSYLVFAFSILLLSGSVGYFWALMGMEIKTSHANLFAVTPMALMLVVFGVGGLCLMYVSRRKNHAWAYLILGFLLAVASFVWLDILLVKMGPKKR